MGRNSDHVSKQGKFQVVDTVKKLKQNSEIWAAWGIVHAMGASKRKEKKKDVLKLK